MSEWIDVKYRLPENSDPVLTCDIKGQLRVEQHHYLAEYPFNVSGAYGRYPVKYWMRLPEIPDISNIEFDENNLKEYWK